MQTERCCGARTCSPSDEPARLVQQLCPRWAIVGGRPSWFADAMSESRGPNQEVPGEEIPDDEHLQEDVGAAEPEGEVGPEFSEEHYTSGQLNAGQQVPGLSPAGEYRADENPDKDAEPGQSGFRPPE